jgi:hypothetical protein
MHSKYMDVVLKDDPALSLAVSIASLSPLSRLPLLLLTPELPIPKIFALPGFLKYRQLVIGLPQIPPIGKCLGKVQWNSN